MRFSIFLFKRASCFQFVKRFLCAVVIAAALPLLPYAADILPHFTDAYVATAVKKHGPKAGEKIRAWEKFIAENRGKTESEKLKAVNNFFNRVPYVTDMMLYGKQDYWATPAEMLARNGGDCEDYAIAKYLTLVALDVDPGKLKIMYVKAQQGNTSIAHMVLTYYPQPNAVPLVMDNLVTDMKLATQRTDLTPVYAFNGDSLWIVKARQTNRPNRVGTSSNMRLWREMLSRMGKEF